MGAWTIQDSQSDSSHFRPVECVKRKDLQDQVPIIMLSRHFAGLVVLLATFLALSQPQAAPAAEGKIDDADPAAKVQKLNRYAMELFDEMNFSLAEKTLLEALAIVEKSNLGSGPAGLATNGNLAVLYSVGLRNPDKAVFHFKKALAIKPDLKMSKQRATPETEANLARAKADMGGAAPAPKPPERVVESKRTEPAAASALKCPTGGEVQAGDEITLKCVTSAELHPAAVILHYKPNGEEQFQSLEMTKVATAGEPAVWVAKIPGSATKAKWLPIYFEAQNRSGATVALSGRDDSPSVITVQGAESTAAAPVAAGEGEESAEEEEEEEEEDIDDNNPLARLEGERRREHEGSRGTWWVSLGFGSGFGYAHGTSTEAFGKNNVKFSSGFALANLGQAVPEVGYFIGRSTALSLTGRLQAIYPRGREGTATGALTGLLRILFFSEDEGKFRWYFAGAVGAGEGFRFQLDATVVNPDNTAQSYTTKDTIRGGPYVAGIGGGMLYKLNRHFRWTIDTQFLVGFTNVSGVLDLSSGLRYQF